MSGQAAGRARRGPWFDLLAMLAIGVVIVGAALLPAVTANAGGTTTIRGDVTAAGTPLPFFPVGFWTTTGGVVRSTRTDANGGFTLDVPSTLDGFAFAGTAPDAQQTIIAVGGAEYVRGIIGATVATPVSTPLYQGWSTAAASGLAQHAEQLHFLLQHPGTLSGVSPVRGTALRSLQVRRLGGSVLQTLRVDGRGRFTSQALAPGDYAVALLPVPPALPVAVRATVTSAGVTQVTLPAPQVGATVEGTAQIGGRAAAAGLPVLLSRAGVVVAGGTTQAQGAYRFTGLAAGDYVVEVGRYADTGSAVPKQAATALPVPIPGVTPTATPEPTGSPTPSATTGPEVALQPVPRTADAVVPGQASVTVPSTLGVITATVAVEAAGRVAGTVQGVEGSAVQVVAEDASTGQILRSTTADSTGSYSIGGLTQGTQYLIAAVTRPADPTTARSGTTSALATASTTGVDLTLDGSALSVTGTVSGATSGTVTVGDATVFDRLGGIGTDGAYTVQGLVPAVYPVTVTTPKRLPAPAVATDLRPTATQGSLDLDQGPSAAGFTGWFISGGAGVPRVVGTATDTNGDVITIGPRTDHGVVRIRGLTPGTYTYDPGSFIGTAPATDGPWWFDAPTGSFTLQDGQVKNVGPVVLHARSH